MLSYFKEILGMIVSVGGIIGVGIAIKNHLDVQSGKREVKLLKQFFNIGYDLSLIIDKFTINNCIQKDKFYKLFNKYSKIIKKIEQYNKKHKFNNQISYDLIIYSYLPLVNSNYFKRMDEPEQPYILPFNKDNVTLLSKDKKNGMCVWSKDEIMNLIPKDCTKNNYGFCRIVLFCGNLKIALNGIESTLNLELGKKFEVKSLNRINKNIKMKYLKRMKVLLKKDTFCKAFAPSQQNSLFSKKKLKQLQKVGKKIKNF